MRDYYFIDDTGRRMPTSEVPLADIHEMLSIGVEIYHDESGNSEGETIENVMERLRIELVVRGLR